MGLNVSRQTASNLSNDRQRLFFTINRQKCRLILTVKKFPGISNLTVSADPHGLLVPEESLN